MIALDISLKDNPVFAEVIPSKIFEAMAMGLPLILSVPPGEASSILNATGAGIHVKPEDPKALASAVMSLSDNQTLYDRLAKASLLAAPQHSRERQAEEMLEVLMNLLGHSKHVSTST